jgi:hypothetical protein
MYERFINICINIKVRKSYLHEFLSGPEVRGTRPVLVTFENFKDRDEVLRKELFKSTTTFIIVFVTVRYKKVSRVLDLIYCTGRTHVT